MTRGQIVATTPCLPERNVALQHPCGLSESQRTLAFRQSPSQPIPVLPPESSNCEAWSCMCGESITAAALPGSSHFPQQLLVKDSHWWNGVLLFAHCTLGIRSQGSIQCWSQTHWDCVQTLSNDAMQFAPTAPDRA